MSQMEFAEFLGVNQSQIARWETGVTSQLSQRSRELLADAGMDRALLGLTGLDFDLVRLLVEAARDAVLLNGKPLLGMQLLARPRAWSRLWNPHHGGSHGKKLGDRNTALLSDVHFYFGLGSSITGPLPASDEVMSSMWDAEFLARAIKNDDLRYQRGSDALLVAGNECRKIERYDDALMYLREARVWSQRVGILRREAEALGLTAYAQAHLGNKRGYLAALDSAGETLDAAESSVPLDASESTFSAVSLAEIILRCTVIVGSTRELRIACGKLSMPDAADKHWSVYYANTAAQALVRLRDPDALDWLRYVVHEGIGVAAKGQLFKALITLDELNSDRARDLRETVAAYPQSS